MTVQNKQFGPPLVYTTTGALTAAVGNGSNPATGSTVICVAPGAVSAVVRITGTFAGTIRARGIAQDGVTPTAGRRIFKAGVGSLGVSQTSFDGTVAQNIEYRFVLGDGGLYIDAPSWSSGAAAIEITATLEPSLILVHAAVHTIYDEALRAGRVFKAGTPLMNIASGNFGNFVLNNPAGSGVSAFLDFRKIFNLGTVSTSFQQFVNPGPITTAGVQTVTPVNSRNDSSALSGLSFTYLVQNVALGGTAGPVSPLFAGSKDEFIQEEMLSPGTSIGVSITGVNATGVGGAAMVGGGIQRFYIEPIN